MENIHEWFVYNSGKTNLGEFQFIAPPPSSPLSKTEGSMKWQVPVCLLIRSFSW